MYIHIPHITIYIDYMGPYKLLYLQSYIYTYIDTHYIYILTHVLDIYIYILHTYYKHTHTKHENIPKIYIHKYITYKTHAASRSD